MCIVYLNVKVLIQHYCFAFRTFFIIIFLITILRNYKNVIFIQHKSEYNNMNNLTFFYIL